MSSFDENFLSSEDRAGNVMGIDLDSLHGPVFFPAGGTTKSSHWSIPWADLMMTMFVFFAVLYIYDSYHKKNPPSANETSSTVDKEIKPEENEDLSQFYEKSKQMLKAEELKDITTVKLIKDKAVKIILPSDVLFDVGKAELKADAIGSLEAVGRLLKVTDLAVTVSGHTDNVPIHTDRFPSNWELSTARACVAAKYLIENANVAPARIQVIGYAENRPISSNETPEGRSANRRVEVIVSKEHISDNLSPL
ncbi:MAG: OmpA family protein [Desulfobacteraceae bacterium]|jgi:chemotaxis protein MotB